MMSATRAYSQKRKSQKLESRTGRVQNSTRKELLDLLSASDSVTVPDSPLAIEARPRWNPVSVQGKPASKIIVEQRD
jgi:hypothetical protein